MRRMFPFHGPGRHDSLSTLTGLLVLLWTVPGFGQQAGGLAGGISPLAMSPGDGERPVFEATGAGSLPSTNPILDSAPTLADGNVAPAEFLQPGGSKGKPADLEKRVADLEKALKASADKEKKATTAAAQKFTARPFGRIHYDVAQWSQDNQSRAQVGQQVNGSDIRRARMGIEGEGFDIFFYRFDVDFSSLDNQFTNKRPIIVDAYLDTMNLPYLGTLRAGHFREFFSLERLDSTNDMPFMERSVVTNTFFNLRNTGLSFFTVNDAKTMTWALGTALDNTNNFGEDLSNHNGQAVSTRLTWLPWYDEPSGGRYYLQVGGSYRFATVNNHMKTIQQTPDIRLTQDQALFNPQTGATLPQVVSGLQGQQPLQTTRFVSTGNLSVNEYQCFGGEFVCTLGPLSFQGEYLGCVENGYRTNFKTAFFNGYYVEAMYLLTGENRNLNRDTGIHGMTRPFTNFFRVRTGRGIEMGSGMWELAARIDNLNLNSGPVIGGNITNFTLGLNWYVAPRTRVMFNYIYSELDKPTQAVGMTPGGPSVDGHASIFAGRLQFAF
jgi:phosphate-selective porin OprO and OprP